jgi:hypothetical protein
MATLSAPPYVLLLIQINKRNESAAIVPWPVGSLRDCVRSFAKTILCDAMTQRSNHAAETNELGVA